ncbi:MAG TPA: isoprenylcysteine carboxylmethyltransferase family protein [Actinomycetota bacterium]|nr:isoprenylcysteine carboxylmethyltransferase family protein [Actinomycetota bacterium]
MLSVEVVALLSGSIWLLVGGSWALMTWWEHTGLTEARRAELRTDPPHAPLGILVWRVTMMTVTGAIPLMFLVDGFADGIRIIYRPSLTFSAGPDLVLQITGIALSVAGLTILLIVGRKLAVHVYQKAVSERRLMTTGVHRYVRHPFYVHFVLLPVGLFLISLNYLALLVLVSYGMLWEPTPVTSWMRGDERFLLEHYGSEAEKYFARTGRVLPRLRRVR